MRVFEVTLKQPSGYRVPSEYTATYDIAAWTAVQAIKRAQRLARENGTDFIRSKRVHVTELRLVSENLR